MSRELWEIVRADQLKAGDMLHFGGDSVPMAVEYVRPGPTTLLYRCVGQDSTFWEDNDKRVFRRISDAEDPRVLRRALERMHKRFVRLFGEGDDGAGTLEEHINQARKELESEDAT